MNDPKNSLRCPKPELPEKEIRKLIQEAGRRPEPPAADLAATREAARAAWRRQWRQPWYSRRSTIAAGVGVAVVVAAALAGRTFLMPADAPEETVGRIRFASVERTQGIVSRETANKTASILRVGDVVYLGDTLVSSGSVPSSASLRLAQGLSLRLDNDTRLRFSDPSTVDLEHGAIYADSGAGRNDSDLLRIRTPLGTVSHVGTQFEVRLSNNDLTVRVREGRVAIERADETIEAEAGQSVIISIDGSVARETTVLFGPEWSWIAESAPRMNVEGRRLGDYLDWLCRETGWTLEVAAGTHDPVGLLDSELRGSMDDDLPIEEGLSDVMLTNRLSHRVVDGILIVEEL